MEVSQTATITVPLSYVGVKMLRAVAAVIESDGDADKATQTVLDEAPEAPRKPGRPKKKAKPAEEPAGDLDLGEELEEDSDAESDVDGIRADDDDEDEAPPVKKKAGAVAKPAKVKALTLEGDIIPAFRDYAKEHGRPEAAKLLQKFKVNSVRDLAADSYPNVLKLLRG